MKKIVHGQPLDLTPTHHYFFSMLNDRLAPLNQHWANALERRFNVPFKPIVIQPAQNGRQHRPELSIVLNNSISAQRAKFANNRLFNLIYPEDLNKQFSQSNGIQKLIRYLADQQGTVYITNFTSVWLEDNPHLTFLGPDPAIAARYDAKPEHYKLFDQLNIPTVPWKEHQTIEVALAAEHNFPEVMSATWTSGGIESTIVHSKSEIRSFHQALRPINQESPLLFTKFLDNVVNSPNSTAIVCGDNDVRMVCVNDQVLRGLKHFGNCYPSKMSPQKQQKVCEFTLQVGAHLARQGFRGLYGLDFIETSHQELLAVDLNPRRQGSYVSLALSARCNLIDIELALALGDPVPDFSYKDFQPRYAWGNAKLMPMSPFAKLQDNPTHNTPDYPFKNIDSNFAAIYYKKGDTIYRGVPGAYIATAPTRAELEQKLTQETSELIDKLYTYHQTPTAGS